MVDSPPQALFGGNVGDVGTGEAYLRQSQNNVFAFLQASQDENSTSDFYSNDMLTPLGAPPHRVDTHNPCATTYQNQLQKASLTKQALLALRLTNMHEGTCAPKLAPKLTN